MVKVNPHVMSSSLSLLPEHALTGRQPCLFFPFFLLHGLHWGSIPHEPKKKKKRDTHRQHPPGDGAAASLGDNVRLPEQQREQGDRRAVALRFFLDGVMDGQGKGTVPARGSGWHLEKGPKRTRRKIVSRCRGEHAG